MNPVKLYQSGLTIRQVSARVNIPYTTLNYKFKKLGITRSKSEVKRDINNPMWRGQDVGYSALHAWIKRRLSKPLGCNDCGEIKSLDLANISQEYKRELSDWEWLCRKCHMSKDGRMKRLMETSNMKGHIPWNKGLRMTLEQKSRMNMDGLELGWKK